MESDDVVMTVKSNNDSKYPVTVSFDDDWFILSKGESINLYRFLHEWMNTPAVDQQDVPEFVPSDEEVIEVIEDEVNA